jgi:N-acetylated-alpha-linked acidic dipeptidase
MRFLLAAVTFPIALLAQDKSLTGFAPDAAKQQFALEAKFDSQLRRENLQVWLKRLSARPHHLGSPYGKDVAEFIAEQFRSWGFDTRIETFYPLFPTPKERLLEMTAPERYTARLAEPPIPGDATSSNTTEGLPVYNAYSTDGDVTGQLVYVNYGVPADYEKLAGMGIDVKGKIVMARYGGSWRGIKPQVAAEHGAAGCIIYSDPRDDGYYQGDVYPKGGWRPRWSAQRGSVMDMPTYPGDPLTPFRGATKDAQRGPYREAQTLTKIPVLPISYGDAEPLLRALGGPAVPAEWRGALPFTYHAGPGPATVHLKLAFNWDLAPLYNVIARLEGAERPEQWVIRGNHHDGWVFGASDPLSALVSMMEEARAVGELAKSGWRPKRTMIYAAWDGEEPALLGSTEWVEQHAEELRLHAAVYVNSDVTGRGFLFAGGSHTLDRFITQVARDMTDPQTRVSVIDRYRARQIASGSADDRRAAREKLDFALSPLGSGSDYTPFLQHLGVASLNIGFSGESQSAGSYHSNYDSYDHVVKFEDPDFQYMLATTQLGGRVMLRFANADVLPLRFEGAVRAVTQYAEEVHKLAGDLREETEERSRRIAERAADLARDPTVPFVAPKPKDAVPYLNFAPLQNAVRRLQQSAQAYSQVPDNALSVDKAKALDTALIETERVLLHPEGLPRRPWYRHLIYAPGYYTGYGVKTLPGIREAIEERQWTEAAAQIPITAAAIERLAAQVDRAAALLR